MQKKFLLVLFSIFCSYTYCQEEIKKEKVTFNRPTEYDNKVTKNGLDNGNIIVGSLAWYSKPKNSQQELAFSAVGMLKIPKKSSRCTGFLISDNIVMTNNHCVKNDFEADGVKLIMNYEQNSQYAYQYTCDKFIKSNKDLDYTLLKCQENPGKKYGKIKFSQKKDFEIEQSVSIIQQNCDYFSDPNCYPLKKISEGKIIYIDQNGKRYYYNADTLGGSSGSPVFYRGPNTGEYFLVALHNMGFGSNSQGRGTYNSGVNGLEIYNEIKDYLEEDASTQPSTNKSTINVIDNDFEIVFKVNTDNYILKKDKSIYKLSNYRKVNGKTYYKNKEYITKLEFSEIANMYYAFFNRETSNSKKLYSIEIKSDRFRVYHYNSRKLLDFGDLKWNL